MSDGLTRKPSRANPIICQVQGSKANFFFQNQARPAPPLLRFTQVIRQNQPENPAFIQQSTLSLPITRRPATLTPPLASIPIQAG